MAGENDQTRWVGIRPTNPAENIPVTESSPITALDVTEQAPLTQIKVEPKEAGTVFKTSEQSPLTDILVAPSAGSPEFLTLTEKRSPAIGDLQAPSELIRVTLTQNNVGGAPYEHLLYTVPADKMFMLNFITGMCYQATPTQLQFVLKVGAINYPYVVEAYGLAFSVNQSFNNVLYDEAEKVVVKWVAIGATDDVWGACFGYLLDKY